MGILSGPSIPGARTYPRIPPSVLTWGFPPVSAATRDLDIIKSNNSHAKREWGEAIRGGEGARIAYGLNDDFYERPYC